MTRTKQQLINQIISEFNWHQVHRAMLALDWQWFDSGTETGVPSIGEMMILAQKLLGDAYDELVMAYGRLYVALATGGFCAKAARYEDGEIILELSFIVEEQSNFPVGE